MVLKVLGHGEPLDLLLAEDLCHLGVRGEEAFVVWVLEVVLLEVGPQPLGDLWPGQLLSWLGVTDVRQLSAQVERFHQSVGFRHLDNTVLNAVW